MNPLKLGNKRELFWDDYLINTSLTNAYLKQHNPQRKDVLLSFDKPWEGDGCNPFSITYDNGIYRLYYQSWQMMDPDCTVEYINKVYWCYLESRDGIHWERPDLSVVDFSGSTSNNIIKHDGGEDYSFSYVFLDSNPDCPPQKRYKATVVKKTEPRQLWMFTSPDGISFTKDTMITEKGYFDSQNIMLWVAEHQKYFCYLRDFHDYPADGIPQDGVRDIRICTSLDGKDWTDPVPMNFLGGEDIALYTNMVFCYPRAPQVMVGIPNRYVERKAWSENFEQLTGSVQRKKRMGIEPRFGLTVTDCVLMTSRDGLCWKRQDEAWITPGIERDRNWVYGDCYMVPYAIQTKSDLDGAPDELSFYTKEGHWGHKPAPLVRYTIRMDGLFSYRADRAKRTLVTKPILYEGGQLHLNFSTSAIGSIYVSATDGKDTIRSCELFGDTLDRIVPFDGDLNAFVGKEITLEFTMSDADLYAMCFE